MNRKLYRVLVTVLSVAAAVAVAGTIRWAVVGGNGADSRQLAARLVELPDLETVPAASLPDPMERMEEVSIVNSAQGEEDTGEEVRESPALPEVLDPYVRELLQLDFEAIQAVSPVVVGWIEIPGTDVSYPLVQGEDNQHYLDYDWKGDRDKAGAIYLDYRSHPGLEDFHTIIYGHRMNDGTMFTSLSEYRDPDFRAQYPSVYLVTARGVYRYDIFAAYEADATGKGHTYRLGLVEESGQQAYINYCLGQSDYDTGVIPVVGEQVLTLSTCTGKGHHSRWVVQAVLRLTAERTSSRQMPGPL